jgi:hypothetical protein
VIPSKWNLRPNRNSSYTYIWQSRLLSKISQKRQRPLCIDKRDNPSRKYNC